MKSVVKFNSKGRWELLEPKGASLLELRFEFPTSTASTLDGNVSYPSGEPKVTASIMFNEQRIELRDVAVNW